MSRNKFLLIFLISLFLIPGIFSFELKTGGEIYVPSDRVVDDDFYVSGGEIIIEAEVDGDLVVAGGDIELKGKTMEDSTIAGGNIRISGSTGDDLRIAGGNIRIEGDVGDDVFAVGGQINVTQDTKVGGNLIISGGTIITKAEVGENVSINGGRVQLGGLISGDVNINAGEIEILPNTIIKGNLNCTSSNEVEIPESTEVRGEFTQEASRRFLRLPRERRGLRGRVISNLRKYLVAFFIGVILILVLEKPIKSVSQRIVEYPLASILFGLLFIILIPIASALLLVTIIGIPFAIILFLLYLMALYLSKILVSLAIGEGIIGKSKNKLGLILAFGLGLLIWVILRSIPVIRFLIGLLTVLFGFGAFFTGFRRKKKKKGI
ncbi:MAG: hypothetical protein GF368_05165 [Candidatus Aenigmarchaeota archaeon]|nr:hypothetical protein [Candidatus Aenigmarchaeota archaeon]